MEAVNLGGVCPFCNSSEIDDDPTRGEVICMNCGTVLEESVIVSDVQFQERGGASEVVGQFVGEEQDDSRAKTFFKGKKKIQEVGSQLRINQSCMDTAYNYFKMCVRKKITRGRRREQVIVACLYMTCRLANTSHLLLDFSDVTQINLFDLGKTLTFITRVLKINLPITDPCLYILRFAVLLELQDKQQEIVSLATRIVQRMKKDYISMGRRPTGVCGAALLLSARAFNVNRSVADIVDIVHIGANALRKRMDEFALTPSGELTIDDFSTIDLEEIQDPPSLVASKKKSREALRLKEEENKKAESATKQLEPMQEEIEKALQSKSSSYAKRLIDSGMESDIPELESADDYTREKVFGEVYTVAIDEDEPLESEDKAICGPSLSSLGIKKQYDASFPGEEDGVFEMHDAEGLLDLSGIDDAEINSYVLSGTESSIKSKVWLESNKEHLVEMDRKRKLREGEEQQLKDVPKKKRRTIQKKDVSHPSYIDAMYQVIKEKKLSNKINWDVINQSDEVFSEAKPGKFG
uniref:B-related factor 1 n=1 Tax=Ditylenchus dipsaci TaxID=166011 RepID=A0A915EHS2_9BILA